MKTKKTKLNLSKTKIAKLNRKELQSLLAGGTDDPKSDWQGPDCGTGGDKTRSCLENCD